uniref:Uncharacterized protein n=1 Tax=Alexandrium andersonii TaxID=327968 RepID=A0A7S2DKW3_9DINO|mmetsp:Transcript_55512/g.125299  ORF Transcript_55512/g.125299 Transcript_55512/m.125299 type:complete len:106 (+) Transcript_55512:1-318(+)
MAAAEIAWASPAVQAAFAPGQVAGFEGVLRDVLRRIGEGGMLLKELGQDAEVVRARQTYGVPNKRKLKAILEQCPGIFELFGEGDTQSVRLCPSASPTHSTEPQG